MRRAFHLITLLLFSGSLFAQAPSNGPLRPAELVQFHKNMGQQFVPVDGLVQLKSASLRSYPEISAEVNKAVLLDFDQQFAQRMAVNAPEVMTLHLPFEQGVEVDVELVKVDILSPNFSVTTSDPVEVDWEMGTYYRGVIKDMEGSIASVSIFDGEVRGMFSGPRIGNYVLGALKNNNASRTHIIYNDADLTTFNPFECGTPDDGAGYTDEQLSGVPNTRALTDCINIFYEVDYDIFQDKGSGTTAWITGNFNEIATLYANENLNYALSQVNVITSSGSAYSNQSSAGMRSQFQSRYNGFNGDMAHMVSYKSSGGIAAGFSGLCNSNPDESMCFSSINSTYSTVPTYSWNIMVQTHEMGHLNGSRHTHACIWNGNNTAIDGCSGQTEGSCSLPGFPSGGGTMMSYCHLQSVGINFSNGFGTQPGNVIRSATTNASCLNPCGGGGGGDCTASVSSYPYSEGFESGLGNWSQASGDNLDWTRDSGGTPSNGTGPSSGAGGSTWYMYVEASGNNTGYPNKTAFFNGPCFDLSGETEANFTYSYHMYSSGSSGDVGSLQLQASTDDGSTWTTISTISGSQGNAWNAGSANLNAYVGGTVKVRFVATTASTWRGDICVDNIGMNSSGGGGGGCTNVNITINLDNYPEETRWTITNSGGSTVASGGTYGSQPDGSTLNLTECLDDGCYNFNIFDSYGDGICCGYGNGSYSVSVGGSVVASGGNFGSSETTNFCVGGSSLPGTGLVEAQAAGLQGFNLYPNPTQGVLNVGFESANAGQATITVTDLSGKIMLRKALDVTEGQNDIALRLRDLAQGSYLLFLNNEDVQVNKRFVIIK